MAVAFKLEDFVKWREVLSDLDEQVFQFVQNLAFLKENRFKNVDLEKRRQELLGQAVTLDGRVKQLESALSSMREFMARFKQKDDEGQLAALPLLPVLGVISLGGVIILVGQLTQMNAAVTTYKQNVLDYIDGGGSITDIQPPNKTQQNLQSLAILAGVVLGGLFLLRRFAR